MKICPKCNTQHNKNGIYCSRSCANSRTWTEEDKKKKSSSVRKFYDTFGHPNTGKPGWKPTEEQKEHKRKKSLEAWDKIGRKSEEHFRIKNLVGVSKYRARKLGAIREDSNLSLIKDIYRKCPSGYEVDHMIPLIEGGLHHQDNLQYLPAMENRRKNRTQNYDKSLDIRWQDYIPGNPS